MDNTLKERLIILRQAGQIDNKIIDIVTEFMKMVENELNIKLNEENASMLVTHMAMTLSRIRKGEEIAPLDDSSLEELKSLAIYKRVQSLIVKIDEELQIGIPQSEFGYIALHLCNLGNIDKV
ncbi:PRD domain-containing protein [Tissierella sp. MSJ-40]|uniref:PRD domain-containing protein n=1 Tax=Tissierella simiarum TaxID=2841534 RepID=A0ABS6E523_9FIRM|nr:PRD domain-containing protein [Tissierella simiarum]MBU5438018.1 PRD domain-containing protein [Tissierella simiarum]